MAKAPALYGVPWHIFVLLQTFGQTFCFPELFVSPAKSKEEQCLYKTPHHCDT